MFLNQLVKGAILHYIHITQKCPSKKFSDFREKSKILLFGPRKICIIYILGYQDIVNSVQLFDANLCTFLQCIATVQ